MRLTNAQLTIIKQTAARIFGKDALVYLFGSRVDDTKKGGDIDLFIETINETVLLDKLRFISLLQQQLGDRKIDALVKNLSSKPQAIFDTAKKEGVLL